MFEHLKVNSVTIAGTAGGTLLSIVTHVGEEIMRTALLAGIGAVVSFFVSFCLQRLVQRWKK
jgi:putative flippase GtrA